VYVSSESKSEVVKDNSSANTFLQDKKQKHATNNNKYFFKHFTKN
jgi:hypothetical protein